MSNAAIETPAVVGEKRVIIHGVSWAMYEWMLEELGDKRRCRLTYDRGELEIMSPHAHHEGSNRLLDRLVFALATEFGVRIRSFGSLTCNRPDLLKGIEPDSCYYLQNAPAIRGKRDIVLPQDPPPDLALEVDISSSSIDKLSIYSALGVPEVWVYDGNAMVFFRLNGGSYSEIEHSIAFGRLPLKNALPEFLLRGELCDDEVEFVEEFRRWIRNHREGHGA